MAFFDFLGQGIGGTNPEGIQGPTPSGAPMQPGPIGPTYGDISKAALQYGSSPGSSGPKFASLIPDSGWQSAQMQSLSPTAPKAAKASNGQKTTDQDATLAAIAQFFAKYFGGV